MCLFQDIMFKCENSEGDSEINMFDIWFYLKVLTNNGEYDNMDIFPFRLTSVF